MHNFLNTKHLLKNMRIISETRTFFEFVKKNQYREHFFVMLNKKFKYTKKKKNWKRKENVWICVAFGSYKYTLLSNHSRSLSLLAITTSSHAGGLRFDLW